MLPSQPPKMINAEDNWELTGNPSVYLDQLPQPYRFINSCLDLLIMRPVFNAITQIEESKKTTEYEGLLKELQATGFVEGSDGITTMLQIKPVVVGAAGKSDKEAANAISNKVLLGDKFGQVQLFDASRKLILDKKQLFDNSRQILHMSTATLIWMDTKLTYVTVVARANPVVRILAFKHNENKLHHLYNLNMCPTLVNPDSLDSNPEQSYLELPMEAKLSADVAFMAVTTFNGDVKLIRMPPIINPLRDSDESPAQTQAPAQTVPTGKGQPPPAALLQVQPASTEEKAFNLKSDIDSIALTNLELTAVLISKIEARKEHKFKDPYVYNPNQDDESQPPVIEEQQRPVVIPSQMPQPLFKYVLGPSVKDTDGGDAGTLPKRTRFTP